MKILMLSVTFPYPPSRGGTQVRTFNLLKALRKDHAITLVTQREGDVTEEQIQALGDWVAELRVFPKPTGAGEGGLLGKGGRFARFLLDGTPPSVMASYSPEMQDWIEAEVATGRFEALTCEHAVNERYVTPAVRSQVPRRVVNIHSSVYGTCRQQIATGTAERPGRDRINLSLLKRYETQYCGKFTDLVVTTPEDQQQMQALRPDRPVHIVTNGVDLEMFPLRPKDPGGHRLVFIGAMDNLPNIDAVTFLSREIFSLVQARYPQATLDLVGSRPTPAVQALAEIPGVTVTGRVPSMVDYLHRATVVVIPMRTGYGIKNKTLEALAAGAPVVASDRGLEGLTVDGPDVPLRALRANRVTDYEAAISRLFEDEALRSALSHQGRTMIETDFTWDRAGDCYNRVLTG
ncbi:glycosyltransferase family 4 protein [Leptolyngbya sp. PCC 6406]|uniref:glycosyltransferase family 4 protein n=1 Tax=Leptolyngbya sp. PCC 6406 TaxID=1173264 RepID=UPI0002ACF77C|nr:glycosyltransferase family 4 protein [Leptolyngbya sp. PCC 6406]